MHPFCYLICVCLSCAVLTAPLILVVISWEMAVLLVFLSVFFFSFPYDFPGKMWYMIVSMPGFCLPLYFT